MTRKWRQQQWKEKRQKMKSSDRENAILRLSARHREPTPNARGRAIFLPTNRYHDTAYLQIRGCIYILTWLLYPPYRSIWLWEIYAQTAPNSQKHTSTDTAITRLLRTGKHTSRDSGNTAAAYRRANGRGKRALIRPRLERLRPGRRPAAFKHFPFPLVYRWHASRSSRTSRTAWRCARRSYRCPRVTSLQYNSGENRRVFITNE